MHPSDQYIQSRLNQRTEAGNYRTLKPGNALIDFSSNDYLGFAHSPELKKLIDFELAKYQGYNGSTGSRLLTGNSKYAEELESQIANYHGYEAGLLFNSGYDANLGLFSCIAQRGDTVIADELIHASIIDGIRLSNANRYIFKHNDLNSLEEKLRNAKGRIFIAVESVYSMDGDLAPLVEITKLAEQYEAGLIVDEAHAIGVFGKGLVYRYGLEYKVFAAVLTFGKAMGVHGAVVLGSDVLRNYLINFARSFIYTTAAPFHQLASIRSAYRMLDQSAREQEQLHNNIGSLKKLAAEAGIIVPGQSAINCVITGSNERAMKLSEALKQAGMDVRPVLSPTVAAGTERLRICMHSYNEQEDIALLVNTLKQNLDA